MTLFDNLFYFVNMTAKIRIRCNLLFCIRSHTIIEIYKLTAPITPYPQISNNIIHSYIDWKLKGFPWVPLLEKYYRDYGWVMKTLNNNLVFLNLVIDAIRLATNAIIF